MQQISKLSCCEMWKQLHYQSTLRVQFIVSLLVPVSMVSPVSVEIIFLIVATKHSDEKYLFLFEKIAKT
jgi:hypothetical protein